MEINFHFFLLLTIKNHVQRLYSISGHVSSRKLLKLKAEINLGVWNGNNYKKNKNLIFKDLKRAITKIEKEHNVEININDLMYNDEVMLVQTKITPKLDKTLEELNWIAIKNKFRNDLGRLKVGTKVNLRGTTYTFMGFNNKNKFKCFVVHSNGKDELLKLEQVLRIFYN